MTGADVSPAALPDGLSVPDTGAASLAAAGFGAGAAPDTVPAACLEVVTEVADCLFSDGSLEDVCVEGSPFARAAMPFPAAAGLPVAAVADGVFSRDGIPCSACASCPFAAGGPFFSPALPRATGSSCRKDAAGATAGGSAPPVPQAGAVPSWTGKGHCPRSHCRNSSRTGPRYECTGPLPPSAHGSCQLSCGCRASAAGTAGGCDRAGRTASNKDRLRACAFMEDSCLFSARCAPAMQALLAARPFLRHNQHEPGVSPPEGRDPVNLWRNNGELFRKRARLHR